MRARRVMTGLLAAGVTAAVAMPALAHTGVTSSGPARGAVVRHLPRTVIVNFSEPLQRVVSGSVVTDGRNRAVRARLSARNASQVRITTRGDRVGRYTVAVTVVAPDGDTQVVRYGFRVAR